MQGEVTTTDGNIYRGDVDRTQSWTTVHQPERYSYDFWKKMSNTILAIPNTAVRRVEHKFD